MNEALRFELADFVGLRGFAVHVYRYVINPAPLTLPLWLGVPTPHVIPSSGERQGPYTHNKLTDGTMSRY